jgi:hypothetical protein
MDEEEKRLDIMMEVDRQNAIKIQEEIEKKRKEERLIGMFIRMSLSKISVSKISV